MGFLKSLFGGKKEDPKKATQFHAEPLMNSEVPLKKVKASVQNVVLVYLAEKYKVGETKYPDYLRHRYGIGFPNERFQDLRNEGMIRPSTSIESLPSLKLSELKEIATKLGLKTSGKKDELCARIAENVSEETLNNDISVRYWIVTEKGKKLLEDNKHICFYLEKHPYSLENIGLDIDEFDSLFSEKANGRLRDILWGEFNRRSVDYYQEGMTKGTFRNYCELLRIMALFLEEENRHKDALGMYMRYIHYRSNFEASISAFRQYSFTKNLDDAINTMYMDVEILPFIATDIQTISAGCGFNSQQLYGFMKEMLSREKDLGAFDPTDLSDLVMCGLNGDQAGQKDLCRKAMKTAIKKLPKQILIREVHHGDL